tara:strand:- start:223 stop:381 length:159 start_codon:yes stop_codon:yes gene_type:complete
MEFAEILNSPIFWVLVASASEIIALTPMKSNSVVQLIMSALNTVKSKGIKKR